MIQQKNNRGKTVRIQIVTVHNCVRIPYKHLFDLA